MKTLLAMMTSGLLVISAPSYALTEVDKAKVKQTPEDISIQYQKESAAKMIKDKAAANPAHEGRPAAQTQSYDHSLQSPKAELIREQKKASDIAIQDAELAKPAKEGRPAAIVKERGS